MPRELSVPWYRRFAFALTGNALVRGFIGPRIFAPADRWIQARSHGRLGLAVGSGATSVLLTTTGRSSGLPRPVALVAAPVPGGGLAVVGSNWGRDRHPEWSENLLVDPLARVDTAGRNFDVRARLCAHEERAALWPELVRVMPMWGRYEHVTDRELRVFVLDRVDV